MGLPRAVLLLLLGLCGPLVALGSKDYYEVLQVPKGAAEAVIKRSYRKLALKYHPDKVSGNEEEKQAAAKKFADINHAYEILSDSEKRQIYDRFGEEGLKQHQGQQQQKASGQNDVFNFFFGGQQQAQEETTPKGPTVNVDLYVSLADLYIGKELRVMRDKAVIKTASGTRQCKCKLQMVTKQLGPGMFQQYHQQVCEQCPAFKLVREQEPITVHVEPGMTEGQAITFFEEGEPLVDGEPGDLQFLIRTLPSARWERRGNDLVINETISLIDALVGFTKTIKHLDGHAVTLSAAGVTKPGDFHHIKGEGMPIYSQEPRKGDLWVQYTVAFPTSLTEDQKAQIRTLLGGMIIPMPAAPAA